MPPLIPNGAATALVVSNHLQIIDIPLKRILFFRLVEMTSSIIHPTFSVYWFINKEKGCLSNSQTVDKLDEEQVHLNSYLGL